jgi:biotin carboxyl carrier protein
VNNEKLKELIDFVKTTDLQEVSWEKKGVLYRFRRSEPAASAVEAEAMPEDSGLSPEPAKPAEKMVIKSSMVGTFYRADSKNRPPLVVEGTIVAAGQPVGSVEAMKIMKDVIAPSACKIVKALVDNGHAVEYGQPLFEVEPASEAAHV